MSKVLATPEKANMAIAGRSHIFSIEICFFFGGGSNFPVFQGVSLCNSVPTSLPPMVFVEVPNPRAPICPPECGPEVHRVS